jgi:hypothetical protein
MDSSFLKNAHEFHEGFLVIRARVGQQGCFWRLFPHFRLTPQGGVERITRNLALVSPPYLGKEDKPATVFIALPSILDLSERNLLDIDAKFTTRSA